MRRTERDRRSKMVGAWKEPVVAGPQVAPSVTSHDATRSAVDGRQTGRSLAAERPSNLWHPVDAHTDHGVSEPFDRQEGGFLDPRFLVTLPQAARDAAIAVAARFELDRPRLRRALG